MRTFRGCEDCWHSARYCDECKKDLVAGLDPKIEVSDGIIDRQRGTPGGLHEKAEEKPPESTYAALGAEIGQLVDEKQRAYGDSFGKSGQVLRILYPDGIPLEKLDDALAITRITDKLFRIATDRDALGESPWRDIAGYALLATRRVESAKKGGAR